MLKHSDSIIDYGIAVFRRYDERTGRLEQIVYKRLFWGDGSPYFKRNGEPRASVRIKGKTFYKE